jgi:hypothetical protein
MKKLILMVLFGLSLVSTFFSCKKEPSTKQVTWEYKYEVTGVGSNDFSIILQNTDNNSQQWSNVSNGWWYKWSQTLTVDGNNVPLSNQTRWLYLSAQDNSGNAQSVTVKIYRNNQVVSQNTSYGPFTIATIDGSF